MALPMLQTAALIKICLNKGVNSQHRTQMSLFDPNTCFFFAFLNPLQKFMLSFSHKKLVSFLIYSFFKNWSTFPGQSHQLFPIFADTKAEYMSVFPHAREVEAGAEDPLDVLEDFLFTLCVSLMQWMSAGWDSS